MEPALPFDLRSAPTIGWPTLNDNDYFIIAIVDVGFGRLDYLAFDFPAHTKVKLLTVVGACQVRH